MAAGKFTPVKNDLSGGQLDPTVKRRDDTDIVRAGCRRAENVRQIAGGGVTRRPGRRRKVGYANVASRRILKFRPAPSLTFDIVFQTSRALVYNTAGLLVADLTGAPWNNGSLPSIRYSAVEQEVFITHQTFTPRVIRYDKVADTWSLETFAFQTDLNDEARQPYFRFASDGVSMRPSALTGDITVEFSAPTLLPGHVGVRFRYVDRELVITEVTDSTHAEATVIDELGPTWRVPMQSTRGFSVGDVVEGMDSGVKGEVVAKTSSTLDVVLYESYDGFFNNEDVIGPHGRQRTSDGAGEHSGGYEDPGAAIRWDEQFMSDVRGWPGGVRYDRKRIVFMDFPQKPEAIVWSEVSYDRAFRISGEPAAGLFELVPNNCRVVDVLGGADEFVLTDRGVFYIPISEQNPLTPGSVAFRNIASDGAANIAAIALTEGVIFVDDGRTRIMAIVPTGQTAQPYLVRNLTEFHSKLFKTPVTLAATTGSGAVPERYVYVANADGTAVVGRFDLSREWVGWVPWTGVGQVVDLAASQASLTMLVEYGTFLLLEELAPDVLVDALTPGASRAALAFFAGRTMSVFDGARYRGAFMMGSDGALVGFSGDQNAMSIGVNFDVRLEPMVPNVQAGEADGRRQTKRRLARVAVHAIDSQGFECCGRLIAPYAMEDDGGAAAPLREQTYRFRTLGRDDDPVIPIRQRTPGKFTVLEIAAEVTV
jgi:hypothetical protein